MDDDNRPKSIGHSLDINSSQFNPELYMKKLLEEKSLEDVMKEEEKIVRDTQSLHSEMQTLVYENYNKFISATDTIKKMKTDFKKMESEMELLAKNMNSITNISDGLSHSFRDTRQTITKLSNVHSLLQKLQFLYKLPVNLTNLISQKNYSQAVNEYLLTKQVLDQYAHLESFKGIQNDCLQLVDQLKDDVRLKMKDKQTGGRDMCEAAELLLRLGEPADILYKELTAHAGQSLKDILDAVSYSTEKQDLIEFIDNVNNGYLAELCLFSTSYYSLFSQYPAQSDAASEELERFMDAKLLDVLKVQEARFMSEIDRGTDCGLVVRALDRLYSKLVNLSSLFPRVDLPRKALEAVRHIAERQCAVSVQSLEGHASEWVGVVRQSVAQAQAQAGQQADVAELLARFVLSTVERVKTCLHDLRLFVDSETSFLVASHGSDWKSWFGKECVMKGVVIEFISRLMKVAANMTKAEAPTAAPAVLIVSHLCLDFQATHISYLMKLTNEWFGPVEPASEEQRLCKEMEEMAQKLAEHYVAVQGHVLSQMVRVSVEARDWVRCLEPRTPRAVAKRVLEELALADSVVSRLFGGAPKAPSSGSSRQRLSRHATTTPWSAHSHHLTKIFSERIDVFPKVTFDRQSILTAIINLCLKTLLECVRLKTFNKFGLQQIQVDTHYLQLYLWKYVSDENIVHLLLDEILGSAVHRCLNPVLMDPSVVEILCERG